MKTSAFLIILWIFNIQFSNSQNYETGINDRIDTLITFDPATNIEEIKVMKYSYMYLNAENCESLPKNLIGKTSVIKFALLKEISFLEFRCNGKFQAKAAGGWEVKSFNLVVNNTNQAPLKIANLGSELSAEAQKMLSELKSAERIAFEQITLAHPQKGETSAEFSLQIK